MPTDLKEQILQAITNSHDKNDQALLMLMFSLTEHVIGRIEEVADQLTIPADKHNKDHEWIDEHRGGEQGIKSAAGKIVLNVMDRAVWVGLTLAATKFF